MELMLSALTNTIYLGNTKKDGTMSLNGRRDYTEETKNVFMTWFNYSGYHELKTTDNNTGQVKRAMFYSDDPEKIKKIESILFEESNDTDRINPDDIGNDIHEFLHGGDK
ncbi:hypothetical protein QMA56_01770 [Leuconostoc falkenbergense]|uniref:DUF7446 family protein n=1 Tax=Leuconostoc falkenbergense TaxID=2766470 RepID=UPI0024AC8CFF|nr:hypothetical protein [Leuconostoc falkenbergense]MDI6666430.1 hypothetical protein [Leuconostoc falkenbergense]